MSLRNVSISIASYFPKGRKTLDERIVNTSGKAGMEWTVPRGGRVYPTFTAGMNDVEKKREIARFVVEETNVKRVEITEEVLKK
jgi:hypothetical protein